jgi:hypothetical protein
MLLDIFDSLAVKECNLANPAHFLVMRHVG